MLGMVAYVYYLALGRLRQEGSEFEARLGYIMNLRKLAWAI
jgi:hypothetical protein